MACEILETEIRQVYNIQDVKRHERRTIYVFDGCTSQYLVNKNVLIDHSALVRLRSFHKQ